MSASQKLGQKLLQGWTMLGDSCSTCNSPLMRSRDGINTVCVVCEDSKKPASAVTVSTKPEAPIAPAVTIPPAPSVTGATPEASGKNSPVPSKECETSDYTLGCAKRCILATLEKSLNPHDSIEVFSSILEASLEPLRLLKNESFGERELTKVLNSVHQMLAEYPPTDDPEYVIGYFKSLTKLIELYKQFKELFVMEGQKPINI